MEARHFFAIISMIAFATAVFSPVRLPIFLLLPVVLPDILWQNLQVLIFINTLVIAMSVIVLSGVPAAIFERVARRPRGDDVTMMVWAVSAAIIAMGAWQIGGV